MSDFHSGNVLIHYRSDKKQEAGDILAISPPSNLRIFVSHSSTDNKFSKKLVRDLDHALGDAGTVWHDVSGGLNPGDTWWPRIIEEITACNVFIVVLSPDAMKSSWVIDEINMAWQQKNSRPGKLIVPVLYRKCAVREDLATLQHISFLSPKRYETAFNELLKALTRPSSEREPQALSEQPSHHVIIGQLPPTLPKVIQQREEIVKAVYTQLIQQDITAVVLTGLAGIGKSTIAALVYNYLEEQLRAASGPFAAEALWLEVNASLTLPDLAGYICDALGKTISGWESLTPEQKAMALFKALDSADKPRLIVLDQFENLLDLQTGYVQADRPGIAAWLDILNSQRCRCRVLFTSRIWPQGTHQYIPVCMQEYHIKGLETAEGIELLRKQGVGVEQATETELREAVARSQGHPLSLTLLASILRRDRSLTLATLFRDPEYTQLWKGDIARNRLDYIYREQLNELQRKLLLAFSVYREAVPLEATQPLIRGASKTQLLSACMVLLAQDVLHASGEGRYQLHAIVADYARDHFNKRGRRANERALQTAHVQAAQYYLQQAATNCPPREQRQQSSDIHELIEAIWQYCQAGQWQIAYGLMEREYIFTDLKRWGRNAILLDLYRLLLPPDKWHAERSQEAAIYSDLGQIDSALGRKEQARKDFEKALSLYRELEDQKCIGMLLHYLSRANDALGKKESAQKYGEEALSILRTLEDRIELAKALNNLGRILWKAGQNEQAQQCFEEALSIYQELKDRGGEGETLRYLGWISRDRGLAYRETADKEQVQAYYEQAQVYYKQALTLLREVTNRGEEGRVLNDLGRISMLLGQNEQALKYWDKALRILKDIGDRSYEAVVLNNLGRIYTALNEKEKGRKYLREAWNLRREIEDRWAEGRTLQDISILYSKQRRYEVALACLLLAKRIFEDGKRSSREAAEVQRQIDALQKEVGEEEFAALLARVGHQAFQIVEQGLHEGN